MTIEESLASIAASLEILAGTKLPNPESDSKPEKSKSGGKSGKSGGKAAQPAASGSSSGKDSSGDLTEADVRAKLKELQAATDASASRNVLKSFKANTLKELNGEDYQGVIDEADKQIAAAGE